MTNTTELFDLRYPFGTLAQFYGEGFYSRLAAAHLVIGHFLFGLLLIWSLLVGRKRLIFTFSSLFIALNFATNPSLKIGIFSPADCFIVCAGILRLTSLNYKAPKNSIWVFFIGAILGLHSIFSFLFYSLGSGQDLVMRFVLIFRTLAVVFAMQVFLNGIKSDRRCLYFFGQINSFALLISATVYLAQMTVFKLGTVPYGTMPSAGFGGQRFGGLAVEGGHLSKFTFPMILAAVLLSKKPWQKAALWVAIVAFFANVSASGYSYVLFFVALTALVYTYLAVKSVRPLKLAYLLALGLAAIVTAANFHKNPKISGLISKIEDSIQSSSNAEKDIYGRSPEILIRTLEMLPLGIGYAGSTQRNIAMAKIGLPQTENNMGFNAFFSQFSFLGLGISGLFLLCCISSTRLVLGEYNRRKLLYTAAATAIPTTIIFIFATDVLWVLPQIWALFLIVRVKPHFVAKPVSPRKDALTEPLDGSRRLSSSVRNMNFLRGQPG